MIGIEYYTPTPEQSENMGKIAFGTRCNKIIYKQIDTNYLAYHPLCGKGGMINKKTLTEIKGNHICPFCFEKFESTTTKTKQSGDRFIRLGTYSETYGYYVAYEFELGKEFWTDNEQVYYASGNDCYHKLIGFDMFANNLGIRLDRPDWKYSKRSNYSGFYYYERHSYEDAMYDYEYRVKWLKPGSKKEYLEKNGSYIVKSNQKKIVMDNVFDPTQMKFIKAFNLKSADEVIKYRAYMKKNESHIIEYIADGIELNVHYLDYLSRNKINLGDYYTFLHDLKQLGFKYEKPTDFKFRQEKVGEMASAEKDKEVNVKILDRYDELPKYSQDNITISPFKSAFEIRNCGKKLSNCIGGYVTKYANKTTDIYHLDMDNAIKVALEIQNGKLIQAYEEKNQRCSNKLFEYVKSFCNMNGFSLGRYA